MGTPRARTTPDTTPAPLKPPPMGQNSWNERTPSDALPIWLTALFFGVNLLVVLNHASWRDEWQPWLIARSCQSLGDLLQSRHYSGHPAGWYLCAWCVNKL